MILSIVVAVSENQVIGKNNDLVWHMPADMKFFKETTMGHCIVTGRKNYESIPPKFRPLPGRTNIVITRQEDYAAPGAIIKHSLDEALAYARSLGETECFIIGGGEIFRQCIGQVDRIYFTRIHNRFEGDVFFDELDKNKWKLVSEKRMKADEKNPHDYTFMVYERLA
jgi:dihydrofolate reductase